MQTSMMRLLRRALMNPATETEFLVALILAAVVFVVILNKVGSSLGLIMANTGRSILVLALLLLVNGLVLGFVSRVYAPSGWILLGGAAILIVVVIAPCTSFIQKGSYASSLFALLIGLAAAAVAVAFVHAGFQAFSGGGKSVGKGLDHNREVEQFLRE